MGSMGFLAVPPPGVGSIVSLCVPEVAVQPARLQKAEKVRSPQVVPIRQADIGASAAEHAPANLLDNDALPTSKLATQLATAGRLTPGKATGAPAAFRADEELLNVSCFHGMAPN